MKTYLVFFLSLFLSSGNLLLSQQLEVGPVTRNTHISHTKGQLKLFGNTFDSTFVFVPDTIQLPVFDDFSTNKFQQYNGDINAPGVTSELFYQLTNPVTLLPLDNSLVYTGQVTFKRTYDIVSTVFTDSIFGTTNVRVGDLSSYPPQYSELELYPPYFIFDTINDPGNTVDTIWVTNPPYVQDSARIFFQPVNDPQKIWLDEYAYHNYRFAKDPRSLGVVTFDGLDETGYPYEIGTAMTNYADKLTSKPIDLQPYNSSDSLYFSFLYQAEGLGDIPESGDSLIVEFYAPELQEWNRVWGVEGDTVYPFRAANILVSNPIYFKKGFQFRFRNYGSLAGGLDHFHVDYVHLRTLSAYDDTLFKDFAFVYPLNSLLQTYTSVPWDHYKESTTSKMTDSLLIKLHNGSPTAENYQNGQVTVSYNSTLEGNFILQGFNLAESNINYNPQTTHTSYNDCSNGYEFDRTKPGIEQSFEVRASASAQFPNFTLNDSTVFYQEFYNYYSYDDGTAEAAFGPTGTQARLAIEYNSYQADSLIGVNIHFVPSVTDVSSNIFLLTVWNDNNGKPGSVIYEDDVFFPRNPQYGDNENVFITYYFKDTMKVAVGTKFHIGWRQLDAVRLNAGLDRNIDNSSKIRYSVDGGFTWLSSPFAGSAMIRPVFSTALDTTLAQIDFIETKDIILYPNPTSDIVHFKENNMEVTYQFVLYNSIGQFIESNYASEVELTDLDRGIYFVQFPEVSSKIFKIVKQ
jgi:hypothetical protein